MTNAVQELGIIALDTDEAPLELAFDPTQRRRAPTPRRPRRSTLSPRGAGRAVGHEVVACTYRVVVVALSVIGIGVLLA